MLSIFVATVVVSCSTTQHRKIGAIEFGNLKDVYSYNDQIQFKIRNNSANNRYFRCAVEKKSGDEWIEVVPSINNDKAGIADVYDDIAPGNTRLLNWSMENRNEYFTYYGLSVDEKDIYRFRVYSCMRFYDNKIQTAVSSVFRLVKP